MHQQFFASLLSADGSAMTWHAILYALAVLGPMIPALVIYKIFPQTKVGVSGPIGSLTMNAGGAFAVYVITFALATPLVLQFERNITALLHPYWTVVADVIVTDDGKEVKAPELLNDVRVILKPNIYETTGGRLKVKIPVTGNEWPIISAEIPDWGSAVAAVQFPEDLQKAKLNEATREIRLLHPLVIPKFQK
jgi:hypothetical protein